VRVGLQGEDFVEVTNGLRAGERVLVRAKSSVPTREFEEEGEPSNGD
jgi:multidrug efflux pump subunit AcrA (membrane-fusion protein)